MKRKANLDVEALAAGLEDELAYRRQRRRDREHRATSECIVPALARALRALPKLGPDVFSAFDGSVGVRVRERRGSG
jgi:hypothetical protein